MRAFSFQDLLGQKSLLAEMFPDAISDDDRAMLNDTYGITADDIITYQSAGLDRTHFIVEAFEAGLGCDDALAIHDAGVHPMETVRFGTIGVTAMSDIRGYHAHGIHAQPAVACHEAGFTTLQEMVDLRDIGADPYDVEWFVAAGALTISDIAKFTQANVSGLDVRLFLEIGVTDIDEMISTTNAGLRGLYAKLLYKFGVTDITTMRRYVAEGLNPRDYLHFALDKGHNYSIDDALEFHQAGLSSRDANEYGNVGITDVAQIASIKASTTTNGVTPRDLPELFNDLAALGPLGERISNAHPAAATTVNTLKDAPELALALEALSDGDLRTVIHLTEGAATPDVDGFRALIAMAHPDIE